MTLRVENVTWTRAGRLVLDGVSIHPRAGETVGVIGPNGSGKSSLLRILAGMDRPDTGDVLLGAESLRRIGRRHVARRVALVDQHAHTDVDISILDVVRLGRIPHRTLLGGHADDDAAVERAMTSTGVADMRSRLWHTLSGGERQRVQIARALAQEPDQLLLDEPTNHLDIAHQLDILALVAELPVTSYVALHDLNLAAMFCDTIVVLAAGVVVAAGPPAGVITADLVRDVYDVDADVTLDGPGGCPSVRYRPRFTPTSGTGSAMPSTGDRQSR